MGTSHQPNSGRKPQWTLGDESKMYERRWPRWTLGKMFWWMTYCDRCQIIWQLFASYVEQRSR